MVNVSWNDAVAFCSWLSSQERKTYGLPTEAEWEYACRAKSQTQFSYGDDPEQLTRVGNAADATLKANMSFATWALSSRDGHVFTSPVGKFRANVWGLYDMHGNVSEWCADWFAGDYYLNSPMDDPPGPATGSARVAGSGSWGVAVTTCRSADRYRFQPDYRGYHLGFRVVAVPSASPASEAASDSR